MKFNLIVAYVKKRSTKKLASLSIDVTMLPLQHNPYEV